MENIEASKKVTPTLFVGLGGMGAKCLRSIWTKIRDDDDFEERLKGPIQAIAVDTDAGQLMELEGWSNGLIKSALISGFDKQGYAEQLRGNGPYEIDEYFTQWCPYDYEFRGGSAAGAGQIRIESRLAVYHECENKSPTGLPAIINNAVKEMYKADRGYTNFTCRPQVHIFFSTAGGNGLGLALDDGVLDPPSVQNPAFWAYALCHRQHRTPTSIWARGGRECTWHLRKRLRCAQRD